MNSEQMHSELMMIKTLTQICAKKAIKTTHTSTVLDSYETEAYKNCVMKFMQAPQVIVSSLQGAQGQPGAFM